MPFFRVMAMDSRLRRVRGSSCGSVLTCFLPLHHGKKLMSAMSCFERPRALIRREELGVTWEEFCQ